jgi:hypothetical protein
MKLHLSIVLSILVLIVFLGSSVAFGQADRSQRRDLFAYRGTWELGGSLGFLASTPVVDGSTGETGYTLMATPYVGYFPIHGLEVGANPLAITWSKQGGTTTTELRMLGSVGYNFFAGSSLFPFAEGLAGYTRQETSSGGSTTSLSGFTWGLRAGLKVALLEQSVLVLGGQYLRVTLSPAGADARSGSNQISAFAGWSVWF